MKGLKFFACLLATVAIATVVFGCAKKETTQETVPAQETGSIEVTITIDGTAGEDDAIFCQGKRKLPADSTAYDALKVLCDDEDYEITGDPSYVKTIGGLGEGSFGTTPCGWMYTINGEYPVTAANECVLSDGDELLWEFAK